MGSGINRSYSEGIKWRTWQQRLGSLILILGGVNFLFCFNLEVETPVENDPPLPLLDPKLHMNNPLTITALKKYDDFIAQKLKTYQDTCAGWVEYKDWVEALFDLAPPAPNCDIVENFRDIYNTSKGTLVLIKK